MNAMALPTQHRFRTVFISDLHLGTRGCRTDFLLDFLSRTQCETLYLVGDIVDGWRLRKSWFWDSAHDDVLRLIMKKAQADQAPCLAEKRTAAVQLRSSFRGALRSA